MTSLLEPPSDEAIYAGKHRLYPEPPDTLRFELHGDTTVDDILRMHEVIADFERDKDRLFLLLDLSRFGTISAAARKVAARREAALRLRACAMFGATFAQHVLLVLVAKAFSLMKGGQQLHIASFETEAQARAWLAEQRRALLAKK